MGVEIPHDEAVGRGREGSEGYASAAGVGAHGWAVDVCQFDPFLSAHPDSYGQDFGASNGSLTEELER